MTNYDDDLARIGVTGALRVADLGTTLPTLLSPYATGWADVGWISDEGITESREADSTPFTPWQSNSPIRVETATETITWNTIIWSTNFDSISLYFKVKDEDMEYDAASEVTSFVDGDKKKRDLRAFGIDVIDDPYHRRVLVPNGEVTEREGLTYSKGELVGMGVTITAYATALGWSCKRFFKEGWAPPSALVTP